jgi:hypothetical protein
MPREASMIARALLLALVLAGQAHAQSLAELYVESEQARLDELRAELAALTGWTATEKPMPGKVDELRIEIRRIEGRIRAIKESAPRPPDSNLN